jgi:Domain of unknown function (DUF4132)
VSILDAFKPDDPVRREAEAVYASFLPEARKIGIGDWRSVPAIEPTLAACPAEMQGNLIAIACEEILQAARHTVDFSRYHLGRFVITHLIKRKFTAPPDRVAAILDICTSGGSSCEQWLPLQSIVRLVSTPPTAIERDALQRLRSSLEGARRSGARKMVERIDALLRDEADQRTLVPGGTWSARVLADIASDSPPIRDAWCELVRHLLAAGEGEPSKKWERELQVLLDAVGRPVFLGRALGWIALGPMPGEPTTPQVPERDADYLKGFVCALGALEDTSIATALADLAVQCLTKVPNHGPIAARVGNACIRALARLPGTAPVAQLGRLRTRVKYAVGLQLVETALTEAAARVGVTPEELEEIALPTFDLDRTGTLRRTIGDYVAQMRITGTDDVELSWASSDGRAQKSVPVAVRNGHAEELAHLKKTIKDVTTLLAAQRARIERLLESDRGIPLDLWRERYPEHPLIGQMARRLIWQFSEGERRNLGACLDGGIVDSSDRRLDWLSPASSVSLWHPRGCAPDIVLEWRQWLDRHAVAQPFKQAHREVYILTDAERATNVYSNRFAGHVLLQHQFAALCRERGWQYRLQGEWDSANTPTRRLPRWGLDVEFWVDAPTDRPTLTHSGIYEIICTDQVRFCRDGAPVPLEEVPTLAFSEAMRDVDLFVGVCSLGNDPTWPDRGPTEYGLYWQTYAVGELSESAKTRRGVLEGLIPRLKIAGRLSLEDRFLVVRGDLATYRIHLGSSNVLMEPGSRYLCIVPARGDASAHRRDVWLPFEGDHGLSIILSKALLLAADATITDPLIVQQIRPVNR